MARNGNAKVPQLNRDVTGLAQTIQQLALGGCFQPVAFPDHIDEA
jgi:hypothetical protein